MEFEVSEQDMVNESVWHPIFPTMYCRGLPSDTEADWEVQKICWVVRQEDILMGSGWFWYTTTAGRMFDIEKLGNRPFRTWQEAAKDCETHYSALH
jgi:hypothetical protein